MQPIPLMPTRLAAFIEAAAAVVDQAAPGTLINPFGHLADGNVHYNLSPAPEADLDAIRPALERALARLATDLGGSFAAEHGLGWSKIALADTIRSGPERAIMARLKRSLDPAGILNPGVILAPEGHGADGPYAGCTARGLSSICPITRSSRRAVNSARTSATAGSSHLLSTFRGSALRS